MRERRTRRQGWPRVSHLALPLLLAALLLLSGCNGFASSRRATATATPSPMPLPTGTPGLRLMYAAIGASDAYGVGTANPAKDDRLRWHGDNPGVSASHGCARHFERAVQPQAVFLETSV